MTNPLTAETLTEVMQKVTDDAVKKVERVFADAHVCQTCGGHYFPGEGGKPCASEQPSSKTLPMSLYESIEKEVGALKAERIMDLIADWHSDEKSEWRKYGAGIIEKATGKAYFAENCVSSDIDDVSDEVQSLNDDGREDDYAAVELLYRVRPPKETIAGPDATIEDVMDALALQAVAEVPFARSPSEKSDVCTPSPNPPQPEPQNYLVQCSCGWSGRVSELLKCACPKCRREFVPIDRMTFPVNAQETSCSTMADLGNTNITDGLRYIDHSEYPDPTLQSPPPGKTTAEADAGPWWCSECGDSVASKNADCRNWNCPGKRDAL